MQTCVLIIKLKKLYITFQAFSHDPNSISFCFSWKNKPRLHFFFYLSSIKNCTLLLHTAISYQIKPKSNCIYYFSFDLETNGHLFNGKWFRKDFFLLLSKVRIDNQVSRVINRISQINYLHIIKRFIYFLIHNISLDYHRNPRRGRITLWCEILFIY